MFWIFCRVWVQFRRYVGNLTLMSNKLTWHSRKDVIGFLEKLFWVMGSFVLMVQIQLTKIIWMATSDDHRHTQWYLIMFGERIPMGTNCAPLLAELFLYWCEEDFIQWLPRKNKMNLARSFNFTFRYMDDIYSLNNSKFGDFFYCIYPTELQIKDTTERALSASYFYLHLEIVSETLRQKII